MTSWTCAWALGMLSLASGAAVAQPSCPSALTLGSAIFEKVGELSVACQEQVYEEVIAASKEPDASLARNNLAILLTKETRKDYGRAAALVSDVALPAAGRPDDHFDLTQRLQLRLSRARIYDFADRQADALDAYDAFLRDGGDEDSIFEELVQCSRRYVSASRRTRLDRVMTIALTLENASDSGQGQKYFRELNTDPAPARRRLQGMSVQLYAIRPPSADAFDRYHKQPLLEMLQGDSCTRADSSILCDVLRAFCRSLKCAASPVRDVPYASDEEAEADFPVAAGLRAESTETFVQFQSLLLRLAGRAAVEHPQTALVVSSAAWFLDKTSTGAGRQLAALIHDQSSDVTRVKAAMLEYYSGSPGKGRLQWLKANVPQRAQGIDLENVLNIYQNLGVKGASTLETPIRNLVYELSTLMPESLAEMGNLVKPDNQDLAVRLFRLAQAQYLAVDAKDQAMPIAAALAELDPEGRRKVTLYAGQTTILGAVPKDLRGRAAQVRILGSGVSATCTIPDAVTGVYVCDGIQPLHKGATVKTSVLGTSGDRLSTIEQTVLPARTKDGVALPVAGDRFIEGWLKPESAPSVLNVTVRPPACATNLRDEATTWLIRPPDETFFSAPLPRALRAGEHVSVSISKSDSERSLVELEVRPQEYDPFDLRRRIYSRLAISYVPQSSGGWFVPVIGATGDWAIRAANAPPAACPVRARDLVSFHMFLDFGYSDRIGFVNLADRTVVTRFSIPVEFGMYAPIPFAAWRSGSRTFSVFAAPLARVGGNFNIAPPSGSSGSGHFHSLLAAGARLGVQRHVEYVNGAEPVNDYLIGHVDITTGRFSNYSMPLDDGSSQIPRRTNARGVLTVPRTKLFFEASADFGGDLPTYSRFLIGYRGDLIQRLAKQSRQWF